MTDDALARLARWDELRRRAAERPPVLDDVAHTLRALAERHPELSVTVAAEDAGVVWRLRLPRTPASTAAQLADFLREHPGALDE